MLPVYVGSVKDSFYFWLTDLLQILRKQAAFSFAVLCIIMLHCLASYVVISWSTDIRILTKMVMNSHETQIQVLANWPMSHAKRVTRDNWKNPEYHVVAAIR